MKRAILLGALAAAGLAVFATPSRAASSEPCQPSMAAEPPCQPTPPCPRAEVPCHK